MARRTYWAQWFLALVLLSSYPPSADAGAASPRDDLLPGAVERMLPGYRPLLGNISGDRSLLQAPLRRQAGGGEPSRTVYHAPFDDVDRDGVDDVLELDLDLREAHPRYGFIGVLRVTTLSGKSGRSLGRYDFDFHSGVPSVFPARVGTRGSPGFLVLLDRFVSNPDSPTYELEAHAVTARGNLVWSHEWLSTWTATPTRLVAATNLAIPMALYDGLPGRATELLVASIDYAGAVASTTPIVVSGVDGTERTQDPVRVPWIESAPVPFPAPDLDGDGNEDVLITSTDGLSNGLLARSSTSGEELWHNETAPSGNGVNTADLGDVNGDGARDFALGAPARLIDGGTGEVAWERPGGAYVIAQGDVDRDGERDVLAEGWFAGEERFGARFKIVNSKGRTLGEKTLTAPRKREGWSWVITEPAGDPNLDGIPDEGLHLLHYPSEGRPTERRFVVSGADASVLHRGSQLLPLGGSVVGRGDDLLVARKVGGEARLTALDGLSGRTLWRRTVPVPRRMELGFHPRAVAFERGRGDVIATFSDRRSAYAVVLDGSSGRPRWFRFLASS
ncbi:MAG TPA: VCBS repeat-containing protein [Actinomycetota bacterium]|nr:VCBS repeat-containing protein [Actinomycetota bacterium]